MIKTLPNGKSRLYTKDGSRPLGPVTAREKAVKQEQAINIAKHMRGAYGKVGTR